jgi:PKD repeat protein
LNDITSFTSTSTAAGTGNSVTNWFWDFGDGSAINTTQNPTHAYTTANTFTVKHWIKTDKGCLSDTMIKQITINPLPSAKFGISAPDCASKDISFTDSSAANVGNITLWKWDLGDGTLLNLNNNNPFTHSYAAAGNYTVTLSVETNKGCKSAVYTKVVTVHPIPVPDFSMSPVCLPTGIAQFTDLSTIEDGTQSSFTYVWDFGEPSSGANNASTLKIQRMFMHLLVHSM